MDPTYVSFGNIFIDDVVLPDGRTFMGTPGGAGTHALIGMRVWDDNLGLVAFAGGNFPEDFRSQLDKINVDLQGVRLKNDLPTTRAWQIFEPDGRRIEIFRTDKNNFSQFAPDFADIPVEYYHARGYHLYWAKGVADFPRFIQRLRDVNQDAVLVWEPAFRHRDAVIADLRKALPLVALFSPDELAAYAMTGTNTAEDALKMFLDLGAQAVAVRMGAAGSLLGTADGDIWHLQAIPVPVVDQTGAGNAYCGGFVVGLAQRGNILEAALAAVVSASFAIEQFGVPHYDQGLKAERARRLGWAQAHVEKLR